jgi:hypothetical protein
VNDMPLHTRQSVPSLHDFWLLLDSYDWASHRLVEEAGAVLPRRWYAKHGRTYDQIIEIAEASDEHSNLAASFESATLNLEPRPPRPAPGL